MIRVFIIDASATTRGTLADVLARDSQVEVVGQASDPYEGWHKLKQTTADVLMLGLEMPRMDGLTFLAKIMHARPLPVLIVTDLAQHDAEVELRALQLGAVDLVEPPKSSAGAWPSAFANELVTKIKSAAQAKVGPRRLTTTTSPLDQPQSAVARNLIAIGASTGGVEALTAVVSALPLDAPGIVIVQHMPARFINSFARRLNSASAMTVREAVNGAVVRRGLALLAAGNMHTEIRRAGREYVVRTHDGPPVNRFRPSVDVLFASVARHVRDAAIGVLLTGIGRDGAQGMLAMHEAGAFTVAQDEATSVVFGMPKEAIRLAAVDRVCPLDDIAPEIIHAAGNAVPGVCLQ